MALSPNDKTGSPANADSGVTSTSAQDAASVMTSFNRSTVLGGNASTIFGNSSLIFTDLFPSDGLSENDNPVNTAIQEATMLFADGQLDSAQSMLESAVLNYCSGSGERLWLMLFDLYRLSNNQARFESLAVKYAYCFEKSPPHWINKSGAPEKIRPSITRIPFQGDLLGKNLTAFLVVAEAMRKNERINIDLFRATHCDNDGCTRLLSLLSFAKKRGQGVLISGFDRLEKTLPALMIRGSRQHEGCWLMFFALCMRRGNRALFEEKALEYALTFEVSPPSWEDMSSEMSIVAEAAEEDALTSTIYFLEGSTGNILLEGLVDYAEHHDTITLDCSRLLRADFASAVTLLNILTDAKKPQKNIVLNELNHLVAELFSIVGFQTVATLNTSTR